MQQALAAPVAVLILVLDNFPYGFLLFPHPGLGISLVLLSAASAQLCFAAISDLPYGLGCMTLATTFYISLSTQLRVGPRIVENTPMLHAMAISVSEQVESHQVIPTILALYTCASLLTSLAFFLLGFFRLERLFKILPKPVLMGALDVIDLDRNHIKSSLKS